MLLFEKIVSLVELLHFFLGNRPKFTAQMTDLVGMILHAEFTIGLLDLFHISPFGKAQGGIVLLRRILS